MMQRAVVGFLLVMFPAGALAGGFEFPTNGTQALGRGGAFTARADDLVAVEYNPGGLLHIPGTVFYLGNNMTLYNMEFTRVDPAGNTFDPVSNQAGLFPFAPFVGASTDAGTEHWRFALAAYGPSAYGHTSFAEDAIDSCMAMPGDTADQRKAQSACFEKNAPTRYMLTGTDILMAYYSLAVAYGEKNTWGVGVTLSWVDLISGRFSLFVNAFNPDIGGGAFVEERMDVQADLYFHDRVGVVGTIGGWYKPVESVELALSARLPPLNIDATGHTNLRFADNAGLGAQTFYQSGIDTNGLDGLVAYDEDGKPVGADIPTALQFTYPMTARAGVRYSHKVGEGDERRELFDVEFDTVWEGWSALDEFAVQLKGYMQNTVSGKPASGADKLPFNPINIPKNYQDTWSFRLGGQYAPARWVAVRTGAYYETAAIPDKYTNLDFASFDRIGVGMGASGTFNGVTLSLAYSHAFQPERQVSVDTTEVYKQYPLLATQPTGPDARVGAGTFASSYDVFSFALSYAL
jgi:long-chain fatty acid transport protein